MKRVYLAGGSSEASLVDYYANLIREAGHEITHDWAPARIQEIVDGKLSDDLHSDENRIRIAKAERNGVLRANLFWLLMPEKTSFGAGFEIGVFLGREHIERGPGYCSPRPVVVSGPYWRKSIFNDFADHKFDTHDEALAWILEQKS